MSEQISIDELRERHKDALKRFSGNYNPKGAIGLPELQIDHQAFGLDFEFPEIEPDDGYREWLGIMLRVALARLVDGHTETITKERDELRAENEKLIAALQDVSCPYVTVNQMWWQQVARAALTADQPDVE